MPAAYLKGPSGVDVWVKPAPYYCSGKVQFRSPSQAHQIAERFRPNDKEARHVYRCGFCGAFHIGRPGGLAATRRAPNAVSLVRVERHA